MKNEAQAIKVQVLEAAGVVARTIVQVQVNRVAEITVVAEVKAETNI